MKKRIIALSTTAVLLSSLFATSASASTYTVKKGDTLAKIAKKYDLTIKELKTMNKLKSDKLLVNQELVTSASSAKKAGEDDTVTIDKTETKEYKIVAGDTLTKIANKHDLTLAELKELNPKLSAKIYVGQTLIVSETASKTVIELPQETISSNTYVVRTGDTLSKIAKKADTTVAELKALNKLPSDTIKIGQKLKIGKSISGTVITTSASIEPSNQSTVELGIDTVISEAKKVIGTPYLWAGTTTDGFDCSGFVYYAFSQAGYDITRHSASSYYSLGEKTSSPQKGDLVYFAIGSNNNINHMGIYIGNDQFIHASSSKGVMINSITSPYYASKLVGFNRIF